MAPCSGLQISIDKNRLLKVCYVPTTSTGLARLLFLLQSFTVLMRQTRQVVRIINQSILLRCLWSGHKYITLFITLHFLCNFFKVLYIKSASFTELYIISNTLGQSVSHFLHKLCVGQIS